MERGANTFPFHNLLPYSESSEGLFLYFLPSLNWIKIKVGGDSCYPHICDTKKPKKSVHRITPCNKSKPVRITRDTKKQVECAFVRIRGDKVCKKGVKPKEQVEEYTRGCTNAK